MAERQSYSIIPAVERFAQYLGQYTQQQMGIAEKMNQLQRRKKVQEFGEGLQDRFAKAKTRQEIQQLTGQTLGEALGQGYFEMVPMIGQFSNVYDKGIEMGIQEKDMDVQLQQFSNDTEVFLGAKKTTYGELRKQMEGQEKQTVLNLFKTLQPVTETSVITNDPNTNKPMFSSGVFNKATGEWSDQKTMGISKEGLTPYIDKDGDKKMDAQEQLNPLQMKEYTTALYQAKQIEMEQAMNALRFQQARDDQERFSFAQLQQLGTNVWRAESELYNVAFMRDLQEQVDAVSKDTSLDETEKQNKMSLMQTPGTPEYKRVRSQWFGGGNLDQPLATPENVKIIQGTFGDDYETVTNSKNQHARWEIAVTNGIGVPEYVKRERSFLENNTDSKLDVLYQNSGPKAQVDIVNNYWKTKGKK